MNWARAKSHLENMVRGELLELLCDDPRAARDIPAAAESEGHLVHSVESVGTVARIVIER